MGNVANFMKLQNRVCNGFGRHQFTEEEQKAAEMAIPSAREFVNNLLREDGEPTMQWEMHNQLCFGDRFFDNNRILDIMDNVAKEAKKIYGDDYFSFAVDALIEAMKADYWYKYEKDWG